MSDPNKPQTELDETPAKDDEPRESLASRLKPFFLVLLLVVLPIALFHAFTWYLYHYTFPKGRKVITNDFKPSSRLTDAIYNSSLPWQLKNLPLDYRYYTIPEGAEEIYDQAFTDYTVQNNLRGVRIPGSVRRIGKGAFAGCVKLTDIVIPEGVQTIGDYAFYNCTALRKIVIPDSVRSIGEHVFLNCTALREVEISDSVESIGDSAFENCTALEEIRLPAGLGKPAGEGRGTPRIDYRMFSGCTGLKKVTIPDDVEEISVEVFLNCASLSDVTIPDSVIFIGSRAFYGCRSLPPVTLGKRVREIQGNAFFGCRLIVPDDHPFFRFEDGILYSKDGFELISCVSPPTGPYVVAPDVKIIWSHAFWGCDGITEIRLPDGLEGIGMAAFAECTGLKHIELPKSLRTIGYDAFHGCTALEEITIPDGVTEIMECAFRDCTDLKHVTLPDSLKTIGDGAFSGCNSLDRETVERLNALNPNAYTQEDFIED